MPNLHQNVQSLGAGGMYGTNTVYGGGGQAVARSEMDESRMGVGRQPSAEYPDGYLGTIRSRRDDRGRPSSTSDKVLDSIKNRVGQKSYQRGVHRGERIDPSDYYYPAGLEADRGIKRQMRGVKTGNTTLVKKNADNVKLVPAPHLPNDGKAGPTVKSDSPCPINKRRADLWSPLKPKWR
jgi:hypothetical protein